MLERVRIHNVGPFDSLDLRLGPIQLLMGQNGSGKSWLFDVFHRVRRLVTGRESVENVFHRGTRTRWLPTQLKQVIELTISSKEHGTFTYALGVRHTEHGGGVQINSEHLTLGQTRLLFGSEGRGKILNTDGTESDFVSATGSSILRPAIDSLPVHPAARWFVEWMDTFRVLSILPSGMNALASDSNKHLERDASNFAAWYQGIPLSEPELALALRDELREVLTGFKELRFQEVGNTRRELVAGFDSGEYKLKELSDGQRALIVLYAVTICGKPGVSTLCFDEPDNYIALREIQPWLLHLHERVEQHGAQALIISHHPELLDQLAVTHGLVFQRKPDFGVTVQPFRADPSVLRPSEIVARGWEPEP